MIIFNAFDKRDLTETGDAFIFANKIRVGILGVDQRGSEQSDVDYDTAVLMLRNNGRLGSSEDLIFYNNKKSSCDSVFLDDALTGASGEDWCPERLIVTFDTIPQEVQNVLFTFSVYQDSGSKVEDFRILEKCFVTIHSLDDGWRKVAGLELSDFVQHQSVMEVLTLRRVENGWQLIITAKGFDGGLNGLVRRYCCESDECKYRKSCKEINDEDGQENSS